MRHVSISQSTAYDMSIYRNGFHAQSVHIASNDLRHVSISQHLVCDKLIDFSLGCDMLWSCLGCDKLWSYWFATYSSVLSATSSCCLLKTQVFEFFQSVYNLAWSSWCHNDHEGENKLKTDLSERSSWAI